MTERATTPSPALRALTVSSEASRSERPRIYVACLAAYNNACLHGRWIDAGLAVEVTVDHAAHDWTGHVGVITPLVRLARFAPARTTALVCGPEALMRFVAHALVEGGVDAARIHVSKERNMQCAIGHCGHCQLGPELLCRDGPVLPWARIEPLLRHREL